MSDSNDTPVHPPATSSARRRWLTIVVGAFALAGVAYGGYWALALRYSQSTDDAYVSGNVVQITPQIAGTVVKIAADDTQFVNAGDTLVELDPADAKIALEQADAKLAKTVREVRSLFATTAQLKAAVDMRNADVARATEDLDRRQRLAASGAVSGEELQHARDALASARAAQSAAQQELAATEARTDRTAVSSHPDVLAAAAQVHDAYLDVARTQLPAPVAGFVAKRSVQLGQRVAPGAPLMAIVPLDQVWVDANFKEPQLATMRSRCSRRRTPPSTGSRSCSACPCASRSTRASSPSTRCRSACRCRSTSTRTSATASACRSRRVRRLPT